ncbi:hypothetical protein GDN83_19320 [Gordonia jinghuaiqii]|uniref:Mce-associated membrane protein n=1 Tax=Gordonia jinghuaiqii TaxID=2758710 RepID=A0A7D7LX05_9ACTN|nr:hypothetical protein [Gordonia jinghuaiqii]MCR5979442.1 hypothetical protein [Gordonia jinghuaiqii]MCR5979863.1 hypothetical protein [Gordonia jinghuaiqii]QMT00754.1 hypothetical protein H1R19_17970 [Gordonia jinghuaiqii]
MTSTARRAADAPLLEPRWTRRQRRRTGLMVAGIVVALVVAVIAGVAASRPGRDPTAAERAAILTATGEAVGAVMTFSPDDPPDRRRRTDALLTDPIRLEYRNRGADVVLPGARVSGIEMTGQVVGVGLHDNSSDRAKVLVFVDQALSSTRSQVSPGPGGSGEPAGRTTPTARWALMRKVDGNWLLSDLQPVGDVTR